MKEAVFPFARFPGVDPLLGPEMRSTGEVMGLDRNFAMAFAKSQLGAGMRMPLAGTVFVSVKEADKSRILPAIKTLAELGFAIRATGGTHSYLESKGIPSNKINKVQEGRPHVVDAHEEWRHSSRAQHYGNRNRRSRTRSRSGKRR